MPPRRRLPRGRYGRSRRRPTSRSPRVVSLAAALLTLAAALLVTLVLRDPGPEPGPGPTGSTPADAAAPSPSADATATPPRPTGDGLAVGITEQNPLFFGDGLVPPPFAPWRDALVALQPDYYRLILDWSKLQPDPGRPADLARPETGCLRELPPCGEWAGVRDQLRALAARQREGGWETLVVITWPPAWANAPAGGCERPETDPRARPPRADALPAYRRLVAALLAAAREEGAVLHWWSPWNEPNHPGFISPQRSACAGSAPSAAVTPYVRIARALQAELAAAPGAQGLALGELAGLLTRRPTHTAVTEFVDALPSDLVCASGVWTQHAYVGGTDPVPAVTAALDRHGCPEPLPIWVTETGVRVGALGDDACRALHDRLATWHADPRVGAAFQYTLREDDRFPTGLVSTDLTAALPSLAVWRAWGGGREARDPPPPAACGT